MEWAFLLDEIISQSLRDFQSDCLRFCEQHYPTIHNRGMKESHLGKALSRRLIHSYKNIDIPASFVQLEDASSLKQMVFRVDSPDHQIYIVAHNLISANVACRRGLVQDTCWMLDRLDANDNKEKRLIIISDHWIDRSAASKSIPSWWLGHQPIHLPEFIGQGVKLVDSPNSLAVDLQADCRLHDGMHRIFHPFHRHRDGLPLFKYLLLSAVYPLSND
ncbi:hypothetical protein A1OS_14695 [Enterovibrio norvegicus]|nr:hypothetical protein A1OS_14695 [Enterovibrio norvegicus]